jgi:CelD/BcsL family acetyltransferase involved in cellulose biosynthesis
MPPEAERRALFPAAGMLAPWAKAIAELSGTEPIAVSRGGTLLGRFPMKKRGPVLATLHTDLSFSGLPSIADGAAFEALFAQTGARAALFKSVPGDGPFWDTLAAGCGERLRVLKRWERAALLPSGDFEAWYEANFERKRRKEYRRLRARLSEAGRLESLALAPGADAGGWADELFALEAAGWKGARGSAVASDRKTAAVLRSALVELAESGALRFWKLALDGKPIAMMFAMVDGPQAWLGKIAYDEAFAKFSPGVLLVLDATEAFFKEPAIALVDSCAIPDHPMINHLWRDRVRMVDAIAGARDSAAPAFGALVAWERFKAAARSTARDAFYAATKRRRS